MRVTAIREHIAFAVLIRLTRAAHHTWRYGVCLGEPAPIHTSAV
jgi:hypothetical protein